MGAPTIIGGNNYRWRGRSIRTVRKDGAVGVTMPRKDSIIMAPVAIHPGVQYKVTVTASKNSGNGALLVNFFGGKHYDSNPIPVNVNSVELKNYTVALTTPDFPKNIPVYLRVWRPNDATGTVFVKTVSFSMMGEELYTPREPVLEPVKSNHNVKRPTKQKPRKRKEKKKPAPVIKPKENKEMKFKPYKSKNVTSAVEEVLIRNAEDVPKVSIITPTRDGLELIKKCYEALVENTCYPNWEWIVGDSASTDGTVEYIKGLNDPKIKLIERKTAEGSFSSINNELAGFATGEYLLFLNDDTEPQPFWLYTMMSKIHNKPDIGIVGAKLLYSKEKIQHAGIAFIPQGPANLGKAVLSAFPKGFAEHDRYYQAVTGACLLIREKDFRLVNKFDPIYYFCYEDVDLCLKVLYNLKKKVLYAARAEVLHKESVTQRKHKTAGQLQQEGIKAFKERWMKKVEIDFPKFQKSLYRNTHKVDISFVTCVNNVAQYRTYVLGSLFKNATNKSYEAVPILNFGNPYSASQALNLGAEQSRGDLVVFCHQDVLFYKNWIDILYERIEEVERRTMKWGVLGTAGINKRDDTVGVVHNIKGNLQWQPTKRHRVHPSQTLDEHCMIIRRESGLRFDEKTINGFHFYGPDLCLTAASRGMMCFGILNPLVHDSASGSLVSGKREFMRLLNALAKKWRPTFPFIRTPTSIVRRRSVRTFVRFKTK